MPIFQHGKNTRTILTVPNSTAGTFTGTATNSSYYLTGVVTSFGLTVGMVITSPSDLSWSAVITSIGINSVMLNATPSSGVYGATAPQVFTVLLPQVSAGVTGIGYDLSQFLNDASISQMIDATETTTFQTGGSKSYIQGLKDGTISLSGFYDGTPAGIDPIMHYTARIAADKSVVVFLDGGNNATPAVCYMANGVQTKYDLKSPVAGVVSADMELQADGGVWRGYGQYITSGNTSLTAAATVNNNFSTSKGGLLIMGVSSAKGNSGSSLLEFQTSPTGSVWTTVETLTVDASTSYGIGAVAINLVGTIPQYTRLYYSVGSGVTANIYYGFARF